MPAMKRTSRRAEKIAFAILGTPPNMRTDIKIRRKRRNRQLDYDDTKLIR